jgi:hypothetical protein
MVLQDCLKDRVSSRLEQVLFCEGPGVRHLQKGFKRLSQICDIAVGQSGINNDRQLRPLQAIEAVGDGGDRRCHASIPGKK